LELLDLSSGRLYTLEVPEEVANLAYDKFFTGSAPDDFLRADVLRAEILISALRTSKKNFGETSA
jgi:hypothetical protein